MEIKAKCRYDFPSIKALAHLMMFKKADPKKRLIFWSIAFAILIAIIILEMIAFGVDLQLLILMGVEVAWLMVLYFWYFITPKIQ